MALGGGHERWQVRVLVSTPGIYEEGDAGEGFPSPWHNHCRSALRGLVGSMIRPSCPQRKIERRTPVHRALGPDSAAVPGDDALHGREADAGAGQFRVAMPALERPQPLVRGGHVKPRAVLAHAPHRRPVRRGLPPYLNPRLGFHGGQFPGMAQQVVEPDAQPLGVAVRRQALGDAPVDRTAGLTAVEVDGHLLGEGTQVHRLPLDRVARDVAQGQKGVEALVHTLGGRANVPDELQAVGREPLGVVVPQGVDEAVNAAQGRMPIMGHRGVDHLSVMVEGVELDRMLPHALFQVGIEPVELGVGLRAHGDVADVALNHLRAVFCLDVADELDIPVAPRLVWSGLSSYRR
jgi:hypothetical protein